MPLSDSLAIIIPTSGTTTAVAKIVTIAKLDRPNLIDADQVNRLPLIRNDVNILCHVNLIVTYYPFTYQRAYCVHLLYFERD